MRYISIKNKKSFFFFFKEELGGLETWLRKMQQPKESRQLLLFSGSVMSDSAAPWTRLPCPSPSPGTGSNSCPLSWWWHPTISSSVAVFSSCTQSFPASGSFPISWLFTSGDQSIGASASASTLPMNIQGGLPLELTGFICLQSEGLSRVFSSTTVQSISSLVLSLLYGPALKTVHDYWKNHSFDHTELWWQCDVSAS